MSLRYLTLALLLGCGLVGCTQDASTVPSAEAISPEAISGYKSTFSLDDEPTRVVSILDARTHLSQPTHDSHAGHDHGNHDHGDHAGHDHADHTHAEHGHDHGDHAGHDHAAHDHGEHAGHDHDGHSHADHAHAEHGHDHGDHAGHDHGDHAGHDHAAHDHGGHDHAGHDHAGHDHSGHDHGHSHAAAAEHRDPVVLVGKIGGAPGAERSSAHFPFEKGKATFVMFDPSFETAAGVGHEHADGHECHFCQSRAQDAQAIVRFVGKDGKPLPVDARELFDIKENDLVVVKGTAVVKAGMLIVDGEGIFVRK